MIITSAENPLVKYASSLKEKKYRDRENKFLAEGIFCVCDMEDASVIETVFVTENTLNNPKVSDFLKKTSEPIIVSDRVMARLSDTVTPQGIVAVIKKNVNDLPPIGAAIILDGIKDPGNAGTIIRTASAIGYKNILAVDSVDMYSPKVVRSTMGGIFRVNVKEYSSRDRMLSDLVDYKIYALDMAGENIFSFTPDTQNFALCVGSEALGISVEVRQSADNLLSLPMNGSMESLNASVAAGIAMYMLKKKDLF